MTSPLLRLAHHVLASTGARFVPDLDPALVSRAVLGAQAGVDPFQGERALAISIEPQVALGAPFAGFLLTSQRLVVGPSSVRLDHVLGARATGPTTFEVLTPRGPLAMQALAAPLLVPFLHQLMTWHPAARAEPPRRLTSPAPGDALGILDEMSGGAHERAVALLGFLAGAFEQTRSLPAEGAHDLAQRALLVSRRLRDGRGMVDGWWVSALTVADLVGALSRVLGPPLSAYREDVVGTQRFSFMLRGPLVVGGTDGLDLAIPPQIASLPPTTVELRVADLRGFATFQVRAVTQDPMALADAPLFVHDVLGELEIRIVTLRTLFAWSIPADRLLEAPAEAIRDKQKAMAPMSDLSKLLPKGERGQMMTDLLARARQAAEVELAKPPEQRKDEARAAFARALESGDEKGAWDAALRLQHTQAYDDGERAYDELGRRYPARRAEAVYSMGDCALFGVLYSGRVANESDVPRLERALSLYLDALRAGKIAAQIDENLWETARALSRVHPDPVRRRAAVDLYRATCPEGRNLPDADARLRELAS